MRECRGSSASLILFTVLAACGGRNTQETGTDLCLGSDERSLSIGHGVGGDFHVYEAGATVGLDIAPQGGFGVPVRIKTSGLRVRATETDTADPDAPYASMAVLLDTYIDGTLSASFLNETAVAYCQDDGSGLMWDLVVGFDIEKYTNENLIDLHGIEAGLYVQATDPDGLTADHTVRVQISLEE